MLTRCPHCSATFRVKDEHLNAAQGMVRCGACMDIFNAAEHLLEWPSSASAGLAANNDPAAVQSPQRKDTAAVTSALREDPAAATAPEADTESWANTPSASPSQSTNDEPTSSWLSDAISADGRPSADDLDEPSATDDAFFPDTDPLQTEEDWSDNELIAELEDALSQPLGKSSPAHSSGPTEPMQAQDTDPNDTDLSLKHLLDDHELGAEAATQATATDTQTTTAVQDSLQSKTADWDVDDDVLFQDDPEADKADGRYQGNRIDDDELSDSLKAIPDMGPSYFSEVADEVENENEVQDESWAEAMLEQLQDEAQKPSEQAEAISASHSDGSMLDMQSPQMGLSKETPGVASTPQRSAPALEDEDTSPSNLPRMLGWTLINTLMLVALLGQLAWFHSDKLARHENLRPLYQKACTWLDCTLPTLRDLRQIKSRNLVVRSHPDAPEALIIDVMAINEAGFPQPFPHIAFQFSDLNGRILAQRLFAPEEYLRGEARDYSDMPVNTPIHISLEIIDPGREAVSYTMRFQ